MKKLFSLVLLVALAGGVWFAARALVHRGEIKATIVLDEARVRRGDPVISNGQVVGQVLRVDMVDTKKAVTVRLDRNHRREILQDSLFAANDGKVEITNTFAVGAPVEDGAVIYAREDRVSRWLARHGTAVQSYIEAVRARADQLIDKDFDAWTAKTPEWKREGAAAFDKHVEELKAKVHNSVADLESKHKLDEARHLKERFDEWMNEAGR